MSMSDILAGLLFLLVPLRHSKADRRMAKDTFALIQDMVVIIIIIIIIIIILIITIIIITRIFITKPQLIPHYLQFHPLQKKPLGLHLRTKTILYIISEERKNYSFTNSKK